MRALVTGAAGFLGGVLAHRLRERGDEVRALVRDPERSRHLEALGCEILAVDITRADDTARATGGCDSVFHVAGAYAVGIAPSERPRMYESNVVATRAVLEAAARAGIGRIVYVSTIGVFGDTRGQIVDETFRRDLSRGFLSYYDETKYLAHVMAEEHAARGAPLTIVQPGQIYGPGDHTLIGRQLEDAFRGRLRATALAGAGISLVHVDDVATGLLLAHDRGRPAESYVLGGEITRIRDALGVAARLGGHPPPRVAVPTALLRVLAPFGPLIAQVADAPPNLREAISAADNVTYWASDAKARRELGYAPGDLESGLRATYGLEG